MPSQNNDNNNNNNNNDNPPLSDPAKLLEEFRSELEPQQKEYLTKFLAMSPADQMELLFHLTMANSGEISAFVGADIQTDDNNDNNNDDNDGEDASLSRPRA